MIRLRNSRGCEYLAHLLARPGERVAAQELVAARAGAPPATGEEQARIAVRKAIHAVLRAIEGEHPALHSPSGRQPQHRPLVRLRAGSTVGRGLGDRLLRAPEVTRYPRR
jgi:hypothetical protein